MSSFATYRVGDELPGFETGPLTPEWFGRYAIASGDHNPLHTDPAVGRAAGHGGVIAHGMLVMGLLSRVAAHLGGPGALQEFRTRFQEPTRPGDRLRCGGRITAIYERDGRTCIEAELWAIGQDGGTRASGSVVAVAPHQ